MFDIEEFDGKTQITDTATSPKSIYTSIEDGKVVYVHNSRTENTYKLTFTEGTSNYTVVAEYPDSEKTKKVKVPKSGKIVAIVLYNVIAIFLRDDNVHFTAPDEVDFYE